MFFETLVEIWTVGLMYTVPLVQDILQMLQMVLSVCVHAYVHMGGGGGGAGDCLSLTSVRRVTILFSDLCLLVFFFLSSLAVWFIVHTR
jgi:hypothetical protein